MNNKPCVRCGGTERYRPRKGRVTGACIACAKAYNAKWRCENPKKRKAYGRKWNLENPGWRKAYRYKNAEKFRAYRAKWRRENPEREKKRIVRWRCKNPDKRNAHNAKRRALIAGADGAHTGVDRITVFAKYNNTCLKCGTTENITIDHIVPLAGGGSNWTDNLQLLCASCNAGKGNRNSIDYRPMAQAND